jgi:hypothetical protein
MTSPETFELEAVDAALAGRYVAPAHAELAELALLLRDDRPQPRPVWATQLDRRVDAGFPARPKRRREWVWLRKAAPVVAIIAVFVPIIALAALTGGSGDDDNGSSSSSSAGGGGSSASTAAETAPAQPVPRDSSASGALGVRTRKVERNVQMTLAAPRRQIDSVAAQIGDITADVGGFVARSHVSSSEGADLQLKVPTRNLDSAVQRISKVAKVRGLSRNSQDITGAYVSARSRLADARAERKSLLKQLASATTLNETESIRARLRDVSREIAVARNSLKRVSNRANFADISVTLVATRGRAGGAWTPGDAFHDALRVLEVIAGVLLIAAAVALPLVIAWLLGWLARRGYTRRRRERALDMA